MLELGEESVRLHGEAGELVGKVGIEVMIGVGAAFDFLSGNKEMAPEWIQRSGLEWLFRLLQEPRRLWRRYLVTNTIFISKLILQLSGLKKYTRPILDKR